MTKKFNEVQDGEIFKHNGLDYKKITAVKISCCRSINAHEINNPNNKIFIQPLVEVETVE